MNQATTYRLRKHADYQLVYKSGRKQFAKNIAYFHAVRPADRRSDTTGPRIGLTVPKALGGAVDRNRIKRRLREAVRHNLGLLSAPLDVVLHPRRVVMEMEFAALERVLELDRNNQPALLAKLPDVDPRELHALGDALGTSDRVALAAFVDSVDRWVAECLRSGNANANLPRLARLAEVWEKINSAARDTESYNLERKPLVFSVFGLLAEAMQ